jgi:hypothetical protein
MDAGDQIILKTAKLSQLSTIKQMKAENEGSFEGENIEGFRRVFGIEKKQHGSNPEIGNIFQGVHLGNY